MILSIIGLGETGTAISQLLLNDYRNIQLNIIDPNPNLRGRILDLSHAGIRNENLIHLNDRTLLSQSDSIFFCAGTRNIPGASRESMASVNQKLIVDVFNGIELRPDCRIIVISNPLDAMVTWISSYFEQRLCVIGTGTLLDSWRLKFIIAQHFRLDPERIEAVVLGEHGDSMVPIWSKTTVDGLPIQELFSQPQLDELKVKLLSVAKEIRETENATKYGVAAAALHLFASLEDNEENETIASVLEQRIVPDEGSKSPVAFGRPVRIAQGKVIIQDFEMDDQEEKDALEHSIQKISKIAWHHHTE